MSLDEQLRRGEIKLRDLESHTSPEEAARLRRAYLQAQTGSDLDHSGKFSFSAATAVTYNAENLIGVTQLPLGITDPLQINGEYASGEFYIPLATTEKSLIAGISRGCKAITSAGGTTVRILSDKMTRSPVFVADDLISAQQFVRWVGEHFSQLEDVANQESSHTRLIEARAWITGRNVFVRFSFTTGDAMGMNMVTRATARMCQFLTEQTSGVNYVSVSGNVCIDKKPAAMNLIEGRGKSAIAEVILSHEVLKNVLKTSAAGMAEIAYRKNLVGSATAGSFGYNAHFANAVAALYLATGQDPAHAVDGSLGFSLMEEVDAGLHASVTMPSIAVATVGGGTRLSTQQEALSMLGCAGAGDPVGSNARKLAEIVAATVLAGEISLLAAEATHDLADAHRITAG